MPNLMHELFVVAWGSLHLSQELRSYYIDYILYVCMYAFVCKRVCLSVKNTLDKKGKVNWPRSQWVHLFGMLHSKH